MQSLGISGYTGREDDLIRLVTLEDETDRLEFCHMIKFLNRRQNRGTDNR